VKIATDSTRTFDSLSVARRPPNVKVAVQRAEEVAGTTPNPHKQHLHASATRSAATATMANAAWILNALMLSPVMLSLTLFSLDIARMT